MVFWVKKCVERDGFCRCLTSKLDYFLPRDTKGQEKKSCMRLPRIPDWTKVKFEQKTHGILDMKYNHYTLSTLIAWQTDLFMGIASDCRHNSSSRSAAARKSVVK